MEIRTSTEELSQGEWVCMAAYEVIRIPDLSILKNEQEFYDDVLQKQKRQVISMLSEIHQSYKMNESDVSKDISMELLWLTEAVRNQTYQAEIKLYLVIRSLDAVRELAEASTIKICSFLETNLQLQKYDYTAAEYSDLQRKFQSMDLNTVQAVIKEAKIENLQNNLMPQCISYDCFPMDITDLEGVVFALSQHPDSVLSIQLIPVRYSHDELELIESTVQGLSVLSRGVQSQGIGNISFTNAERNLDTYKYYFEKKESALFTYNLLVSGDYGAVTDISAKMYSLLQENDGNVRLRYVELSSEYVDFAGNFFPLPWAAQDELKLAVRESQSGIPFFRLPLTITAEECAAFFRLPVGNVNISAGLSINYADKNAKTFNEQIINSGEIEIGTLKSSGKDKLGVQLDDLTKHLLVTGTPGSGKTTFLVGLLDRLWKQCQIPFLVIEPAKNEYRALIDSIPDVQIFTPGKNFISPFIINPFVPPENVKLETYKSTLKTAFAASMSMETPLDKIFEETIHNCYADFHWLDSYTTRERGQAFNIDDFIRCFEETFAEIGYTGDASNIGKAGVVRLRGIARLFDNYFTIPISDIISRPTIVELSAIENPEEKALIISLLLLSILSYINSNYLAQGHLKNIILLEEAHVLLDTDTNVRENSANPSLIAQNLVKRMLAELRAYGVGMVIADQSPRKVTSDVVALTDMKVTFRLVEKTDRDIIANSMDLSEAKHRRLARLKPGEAYFFFQKLEEPEEVHVENYRQENKIAVSLSDEELVGKNTYWQMHQEMMQPYPECKFHGGCGHTCDYKLRLLGKEIARQIFRRHFKKCREMKEVAILWTKIKPMAMAELNGEAYSERLMACVQAHLLRKIKYESEVGISDTTIKKTLEHFKM